MKKKLTSILAALCFLSTTSFAIETPKFYTIRGFEKGLNTANSAYLTPENQGIVANNVRLNKVVGGLTKRSVMASYGTVAAHSITSIFRYYKSDGTKKLLATGSTKLYVGSDTDGTFQTLRTGLTDGKPWQWVTYKDVAIGMNGFDKAVKFDGNVNVTSNTDGHRTASNVVADLGAPFAELNTGANLDASSWYMYKVAFYDGSTYSYSTARSNAINTGATVRDVTLTDIPLGPTGTTQRIIYRTSGTASEVLVKASSTYYKLAAIADNTTTTYNDAIVDATIEADPAPTWATVSAGINATPPLAPFCNIHNERLFVGGNDSDIFWSDVFNPNYFDPDDYLSIRADDGDHITFIKTFLGILTIGKNNTIQKIYTEGASTEWSVSDPFSFIGSPAPYSVAVSPVGIIYLARDGLYSFNGQNSQLLSDPIKPVIEDILPTGLALGVAGIWYKNEYHLAYTSAISGETANNRVLVLDTVRNAYSIDTKDINCFTSFSSGDDFGTLYMGDSSTGGKVWADEGSLESLSQRLVSEFNSGTFDDARVTGDENDPEMELSWDLTINQGVGTINAGTGIINRPDTDGSWVSPAYEINASSLDLLYWNESLAAGDVTFKIRTGATLVALSGATYSSAFTNPNGSDISGVTGAKYIQVKIDITTTTINTSPNLFVTGGCLFKLTYSKAGSVLETSVLSEWVSGFKDFNFEGHRKFIRRVKVFYSGTSGTMNVTYRNEQGTAERTFAIDLSKNPDDDIKDPYSGNTVNKVYTHFPAINLATNPAPVGEFWQFEVSEDGTADWSIDRIEIMYFPEELGNT